LRVAIIGGTGMIGAALAQVLESRGDEVWIVSRKEPRGPRWLQWGPSRGIQNIRQLEGLDALVNLNGAALADRPWTTARRRVLLESRVDATRVFARSLAQLDAGPGVFVGVGHLGRFGDRGAAWIQDTDAPGSGFLAELCVAWEDAQLSAARNIGCRGAVLRMGMVLSPHGGAFPLIVMPFRYGFGGWMGNGRQYTAWLSIRDVVGMLVHLIDHEECSGGFNGNIPDPVENKRWCVSLGKALERPVRTHAPKWAMRGALGELANDVFLASCRAVPRKLLDSGYEFIDTDVAETFGWLLAEID